MYLLLRRCHTIGMQRFGTSSVPSHMIGLALLRSDWDLAVDLILSPRDEEDEDMVAGRKAWIEERDVKKALDKIPRRAVAERCGTFDVGYIRFFPDSLLTMLRHMISLGVVSEKWWRRSK
jgi:tRNA(Glu) U13 pseudouridine synthase TruD